MAVFIWFMDYFLGGHHLHMWLCVSVCLSVKKKLGFKGWLKGSEILCVQPNSFAVGVSITKNIEHMFGVPPKIFVQYYPYPKNIWLFTQNFRPFQPSLGPKCFLSQKSRQIHRVTKGGGANLKVRNINNLNAKKVIYKCLIDIWVNLFKRFFF